MPPHEHETNSDPRALQCGRYWGANYTNGGKECDEYPFATTYEGGAEHDYDPEVRKFNFSVKPIPKDDNRAGRNLLQGFYGNNRVIDGDYDGFIVKTVTWPGATSCRGGAGHCPAPLRVIKVQRARTGRDSARSPYRCPHRRTEQQPQPGPHSSPGPTTHRRNRPA
ncbi:NucA/NucB deoxyribonuclease domain-containing protein [Streptomyces mirabilis]